MPIVSPSLRWNGAPSSDSAFFFFFFLETCWLWKLKKYDTSLTDNVTMNEQNLLMEEKRLPDEMTELNDWVWKYTYADQHLNQEKQQMTHLILPSLRFPPMYVCLAGVWPTAESLGRGRKVQPDKCEESEGMSRGMHPKPAPL